MGKVVEAYSGGKEREGPKSNFFHQRRQAGALVMLLSYKKFPKTQLGLCALILTPNILFECNV